MTLSGRGTRTWRGVHVAAALVAGLILGGIEEGKREGMRLGP
jgi:hypothetical protein